MLGSIGSTEIVILVFLIILLFGGKELPNVVRTLAKGWHSIQKTRNQVESEIQDIFNDQDDFSG